MAAWLSPLGLFQIWSRPSRAGRPPGTSGPSPCQAGSREHLPPCPCTYTTRQNQGSIFFPLNYSIFILETFQGERDPGTHSSTRSVPQSQCQVLAFPTSCSGMGAGPWPLPAMGHRRKHLRRNVPKTGWFGYSRCPGKGQNPDGGAGLYLGKATHSAG